MSSYLGPSVVLVFIVFHFGEQLSTMFCQSNDEEIYFFQLNIIKQKENNHVEGKII